LLTAPLLALGAVPAAVPPSAPPLVLAQNGLLALLPMLALLAAAAWPTPRLASSRLPAERPARLGLLLLATLCCCGLLW
jgi:hypothetical protein